MPDLTNITRIKAVASALQELSQNVVFVGGATVSLYSGIADLEARPTDDVDVVIELATYGDFSILDARLREIGFRNDVESGVICRYLIQGIIVDIMPTKTEALGFSNGWYPEGFANAIAYQLDDHQMIRIFSIPYFIASKIEAFNGRGNADYRFSSDFEDIVFVLENGMDIEGALQSAPVTVKDFLRSVFDKWLTDPDFHEGLTMHLSPHTAGGQIERIMKVLRSVF